MTRKINRLTEGITRRNALKAGIAVSSGLAFGGTAIGTAGAKQQAEGGVVPEHHFVRKKGTEHLEPESPKPEDDDKLVERREGYWVDDGTTHDKLDGHWFTWNEFSNGVDGTVTVDCQGKGTDVSFMGEGLIPNGLYTVWVVTFEEPGFHFDSREIFPFGADGTAAENVIGAGALGWPWDDEPANRFRADNEGKGMVSTNHPKGELSIFGEVGNCLLDEFELHFVIDFHLDDQTHGAVPGGPGEHVEHVGAAFKEGESLF